MKENNVNVYDEKNINEKSEDVRLTKKLTNDEKEKTTGEYDKFKNRMASLFKEFEHDKNNLLKNQTSSAINFSERELDLNNGCKFLLVILIIVIISIVLTLNKFIFIYIIS